MASWRCRGTSRFGCRAHAAQGRVAQVEQVAIDRSSLFVAHEHRHVDRQVAREARGRRERGVAAARRRLDVDQHALDVLLALRERQDLPRAALEQIEASRASRRGRARRSANRARRSSGADDGRSATARYACAPRARARSAWRELLRRASGGRDQPQAADRRRQRVHPFEARRRPSADPERKGLDVARRARSVERERGAPGRCALASVSVAHISSRRRSIAPTNLHLHDLRRADHRDRK